METLDSFQVYSFNNGVSIMVDKIWIDGNRIFFRVLKELKSAPKYFRRENSPKVYSMPADSLYSLRCRLYF